MNPRLSNISLPFLSVVLPTYNRAHTLRAAIRSVLSQDYSPLELIVVDDCSTDDSSNVIDGFNDDRLVYIRHNTNLGAAAARNTGILAAKGELIAFQDSDDEWLGDKLVRQVMLLKGSGCEYGAVFGGKLLHGRNSARQFGARLATHVPGIEHAILNGDLKLALLEDNFISVQTLVVKKDLIIKHNCLFDPMLRCNEDWDFNIRLSALTKFVYVEKPAVVAFISNDSISTNKRRNVYSQIYIVRKNAALFQENQKIYIKRLCRIAMSLARINKPRLAFRFLRKAVAMDPFAIDTWKRLVAYVVHRSVNTSALALRK